jgi:hypothetical protein
MTPEQMSEIVERVRRSFPHQAQDDLAIVVWTEALIQYPYEDVRQAVLEQVRERPFVSVAEIAQRVRDLRQARWESVSKHVPEPNVDPDDAAAYLAEQRAIEARVLDGHWGLAEVQRYPSSGRTLTGAPVYARPEVVASAPRPHSVEAERAKERLALAVGRGAQ